MDTQPMNSPAKGPTARLRAPLPAARSPSLCVAAQESKPTVRHHRVAETVPDDASSPEVEAGRNGHAAQ